MQSKVGHIPHFGPHVITQLITWELYLWSLCSGLVCAWLKSLVFLQIIWRTFQKTRRIIRTHKVNPSAQTLDIIVCNVCHKNETFNFSSSPKTAALSIVKEVANHANDIMKQGVRLGHHSKSRAWYHQCLSGLTLVGFVFFSGQLPEADADSVQSERSPRDRPARQSEFRRFNGASEMFYQQWIWSKKDKQNCLSSQVFLKEGTLMKLSRKVMQPRVFFLVRLSPKWNHVFLRVFSRGLTTVVYFFFSRFCAVQRRSDVHHSSPVGSV